LLVDQHAQDLALRFARHFADFIEIEDTAMSFLERACATRLARRALGAEQRDFHAFRRDGGCIQRHERTFCTRRFAVDQAGHELLARARRPEDHHAAVGRRDLVDRLTELGDRHRRADQLDGITGTLLEVAHFALQLRGFERALGNQDQRSALKGFSMKS
jgi:hypothetical protein